jgi:hypothetical protein
MFSDEFNFPKKDADIDRTSWNAASLLPAREIYFSMFSDEFNFPKKDADIDRTSWNAASLLLDPVVKHTHELLTGRTHEYIQVDFHALLTFPKLSLRLFLSVFCDCLSFFYKNIDQLLQILQPKKHLFC